MTLLPVADAVPGCCGGASGKRPPGFGTSSMDAPAELVAEAEVGADGCDVGEPASGAGGRPLPGDEYGIST